MLDAAIVTIAGPWHYTGRILSLEWEPKRQESIFRNVWIPECHYSLFLLQNSLIHQVTFPVSPRREFSKSHCRAGTFSQSALSWGP